MCPCNCKDILFELHVKLVKYVDSLQQFRKNVLDISWSFLNLRFILIRQFFKCLLDVSLQLQGHSIRIACQMS